MAAPDPARNLRVVREPTVYLLDRQTVDEAEWDRSLTDHEVSWRPARKIAWPPESQPVWLDAFAQNYQASLNLAQNLQESFKDDPAERRGIVPRCAVVILQ